MKALVSTKINATPTFLILQWFEKDKQFAVL